MNWDTKLQYSFGCAALFWVLIPISFATGEDLIIPLAEENEHPLAPIIRFANDRSEYIRKNIRDYSCRLIKRERIDGELQAYQFLQVKVRCEHVNDDNVEQPMAVFMRYLAPEYLKDRRVLYVDGQRNGQMLVRKGGRALSSLTLHINPNSNAARRESKYSVTEVGFDRIVERLVQFAQDDIAHDPSAENTKVSYLRNAMIGQRKCTHIKIDHPQPSERLEFHQASLFIDDEWQMPTRLVVRGWPTNEAEEPPLFEEYTYVDLQLNIGLTDADFDESLLK